MEQISDSNSCIKRTPNRLSDYVWNDIHDSKKYECYLAYYLQSLRTKKKQIRWIVIVISIVFIVIDKWFGNAAYFGLTILAVFELFKEIIPGISVDENLIDRLPEYRMLYVQKCQKLQSLYYKLDENIIILEDAELEYFEIKNTIGLRIEELDNALHIPEKKRLFDKADKNTTINLNNMYQFDEQKT